MVADGMLTRKRYREVPPRVDYELTERARDLMPTIGALARWGYEWAWGSPRSSESIDIGAIFRLAPGLLEGTGARPGTVELVVTDAGPDGSAATYHVAVSPERVEMHEREASDAGARIAATESDWIRALSPARDRSGLNITGDTSLAEQLLDGLSVSPAAAEHAAEHAA
jgi:hypothetical protein